MPSRVRVLVMDDEPAVADSLVLVLKLYGYDASCVHSAESAIEYIKSNPCDVLISDVVVDGQMTGIELAIQFAKLLPLCKVLLMSGNNSTAELLKEAAKRGHSFDVLPKPVRPSIILERLKHLIV